MCVCTHMADNYTSSSKTATVYNSTSRNLQTPDNSTSHAVSAPLEAQVISHAMSSTNWKDRVEAKLAENRKIFRPYMIDFKDAALLSRDVANIFSEDGTHTGRELLTAREKMMTEEPDAVVVLDLLRRGEWSCTELVTAYIKR